MQKGSFSQLCAAATFHLILDGHFKKASLKHISKYALLFVNPAVNRMFILYAARRWLARLSQCLQPASFKCDYCDM